MGIENLFQAIKISASGLAVQRQRMNVTARNIANVDTIQTEQGGPYRRKLVILKEVTQWGRFRPFRDQVRLKLRLTHGRHLSSPDIRGPEGIPPTPLVEVDRIVDDPTPPKLVYDPSNPYANEEGYVAMPNINIVTEMVDMMLATRAYEANATTISAAKEMAKRALEI